MRQSLYARSHTFSRVFVFTMPKFLQNFWGVLSVPLCSEIFTGQTHTSIDRKFQSGSFGVWFVDWIFQYRFLVAVFLFTMPV